jgi:hypothetical protein
MFEIGIFCVILFAVLYWAILFVMGRRDDVLHGEFVEAGPPYVATSAPMASPAPAAPLVPAAVAKQKAAQPPAPIATSVLPPQFPNLPPANPEALQSLLVSLKQELKNAAKI